MPKKTTIEERVEEEIKDYILTISQIGPFFSKTTIFLNQYNTSN